MNIKYRPEIDGLRAIAVLSVIFYHAQLSLNNFEVFKGGYIGVDIFFVISGYLITSIILKELILTKKFSFRYFYERRVRRLIPPLVFVILLSIPLAWIYLLPSSLVDFTKSALYSLGFTSNYFFYFSELDYFDTDGLYKPLLHTWSLAVEEQYYLIFPFFLIFLYKFFRNKILLIFISILSLNLLLVQFSGNLKFEYPFIENIEDFKFEAASVYFYKFYFLNSRFWELLAGSVLAYLEINNYKKTPSQTLTILGFLMIMISIFFFNSNIYYPSFYTAIPVMGVCLIIWFSNNNDFIFKVLSSKILVGIGLLSYSLYLWHYPLFAFKRINDFYDKNFENDIGVFLILILISIFSYFLIEKPARNKSIKFLKIISILSLTTIVIIITSISIIKNKGFTSRFEKIPTHENYEISNRKLINGWRKFNQEAREKKVFLPNKKKVLIIGDSHAEDLFHIFFSNINLFKNYDFLFEEFIFDYHSPDEYIKKKVVGDADIIMISYNWQSRFDMRSNIDLKRNIDLKKKLKELTDEMIKNNKKVIITSNTNEYPGLSGYTLIDYLILLKKDKKFDYFGYKKLYYDKREVHTNTHINILLKDFSEKNNFTYLNKEDYLCNIELQECDYLTPDGHKIFHDQTHYTIKGAKYLGKKIYKLNLFEPE
jgi:peptidoglycan/LPS O-acetylase OafA/YrhL